RAHAAEFKRRAMAFLSFVAVPRVPDAADSAAARARVRRLRVEAVQGLAKFEEVAKRESADSVSGAKGGDLGWIRPDASGFDPLFLKGLKGLSPGQVSAPVLSRFGYHLIRVDAVRGDSVRVRHILVPVVLQGAHLDAVDARAVSLDRLAAERAERKKEIARQRAEQMAARYKGAKDLLRAGAAAGLPVEKLGPFTRVQPPAKLSGEPLVLGAAFGLRPGATSGLLTGQTGYFL